MSTEPRQRLAASHVLAGGVRARTAADFSSAVCFVNAASDYKQFFT